MRSKLFACLTVLVVAATSGVLGQTTQSTPPAAPPPAGQGPKVSFKGGVNLILVDVNVRDKNGAPIKGLKASDFELLEGGKAQDILTFAFEEIAPATSAIISSSTLATAGNEKGAVPVTMGLQPKNGKPVVAPAPEKPADKPADKPEEPAAKIDASTAPLTSDTVAGHRVWVLLFDTSSMQPDEVQKAA